MVLVGATLSDATQSVRVLDHSNAPASAAIQSTSGAGTGATSGAAANMKNMAKTPTATDGGTSAVTTASDICPNVKGTTTMPDGMVMAPVPSGKPTAAEQAAANQLVAETTKDVAQYANLSAAENAGYVPLSPGGRTRAAYEHYMDFAVIAGHDVLDPAHPSALMFANTVDGPVLIGAMFLGPAPCQVGPDVGGPLTQWHAHDNLCLNTDHQLVGRTTATGTCTVGTHKETTYFMLHVWTAPQLASQYQFQADPPRSAFTPIIESGQA